MKTLAPRGYGSSQLYRFSPPNQFNTGYYHGRYPKQRVSFAPHYPTKPLYQPPFYPVERNVAPAVNQFRQPGLGTELVLFFNELDAQYRYDQYVRQLQKREKQYWKQQGNNMPPPMYPGPPPLNYSPGTVYQYEKETKYVPFPVYVGPGAGVYGTSGHFGGAAGSNTTFALGGGMDLPPKIRVIFIPTGQSFAQQPCTGSLTMPPFLYNRISQPLCSFPLPPPLPQLGSLPLTPAVQQMVMQRYSNPVAVLPFASNCQTFQSMMPNYSLVPQQQQQQYIAPISAVPALLPPPQAYIPAPPTYVSAPPPPVLMSSLPPVPQTYIPATPAYAPAPQTYIPATPAYAPAPQTYIPAPQAYIPVPQTYIPAPQAYVSAPPPPAAPQTYIPALPSSVLMSSLPPAPQEYIPPPPPFQPAPQVPSATFPPPASQFSSLDTTPASSLPQYPYSSYPSICRACPPAPPPLSINVTGHCWIQHCSACHHVPTPISHPNVRPSGGRITPLLRQPIVPQYVPEQARENYFHTNAPVMMRPWLRKTPPLPPGAVVISDKYIDKSDFYSQYDQSQRQHRQHKRGHRDKHRSTTVSSRKTNNVTNLTAAKNHRSVSPRRLNNNNANPIQHQVTNKTQGSIPSASTSTSSSGLSSEYEKITLNPPQAKENTIPQPFIREARIVNLQYKYRPEELPAVYLINRYLKSSSEASALSSNNETPLSHSSSATKELSPTPLSSSSSSTRSHSTKNEPQVEKDDEKPPRPPSHSKKSKEKVIIIREFATSSPSTASTISSNMSFSIVGNEEDSISTTSTLIADNLEGDDTPCRNIF